MRKHKKTQAHPAVLLLLSMLASSALASQLCEGVAFMPSQMTLTRAKDQPGLQSETDSDEMHGLVDVHSFNHYYTFQVDRDVNERNEGVVMDLVMDHERASTTEGFAFRLRAEFNSAEASRTGMGFRVILGAKVYDQGGYTIETLAEMSSLNTEEGEGTVAIDIPSLPAGRSYQLRYEFGQKEVLRNGDSLSMEEDSVSTGDSIVHCNLPFFTQELVLIDRKVLKNRVKKYNQTPNADELDIAKHAICDFSLVNGEEEHAELGLNCSDHVFSYPIGGKQTVHDVDDQGFVLRKIAEYPFKVSGTDSEPITQLFKMTVGQEFAFGAGFRAILHRVDGVLTEYEELHPFACLLDQSCQFAWRQQKNHQSFQVVLTTGDYVLQLFDLTQHEYTTWLTEDLQLSQVPFTVYIESFPILQNEVRDHCPFIFLLDDFIQTKFIDGQTGQKFHFADKIIMNLYNLKQEVMIQPELDSHLKVTIRSAFGVNTMIQLCKTDSDGYQDCFMHGNRIGTTQILYSEELRQDQHYTIILDYSHSILAFHKFDICPHLPVEISMISASEAEILNKNRYEEVLGLTDKQSRSNLQDLFKRMSNNEKIVVDNPDHESAFMLTSRSDSEFEVLYSHDFKVNLKMGLFLEVFYSPYDDEVMELYLAERYDLMHSGHQIQADLEDEYDNDDAKNKKVFGLNKYKSSKTIWVDLEPGEYTIQILMFRQPSKETTSYYEKVNFQLYMKYDFVNVPREAFLPGHLNYHGLLGSGDETHDFGHITLFWDDLTLWHKSLQTLFQVQSEMASVSIQLEQGTDLVKVHLQAYDQPNDKWVRVGHDYHDVASDQRIDTIEEAALTPNHLYKIVVFKDNFSEHAQIENVEMGERYGTEFSIKIDFSEFDDSHIAENLQKNFREFLPVSLDQVAKEKKSLLGLNEKSFTMGNRNMIHLIEYGDGWKDQVIVPSYVPKDRRIFISKQTEDNIVTSLPFEVNGIAEVFYAGIYEYTQGANLMSLAIVDDESHEEIAISRQGKYFSLLSGIYLPEGNYYLVVKNDRVAGIGTARQAPLEFALDVVRHQIPDHEDFLATQLEAMQLCHLPAFPSQGLSKPGYLHPLSGQSTQAILKVGVQELDSGSATNFVLTEDSFLTVYVEAAEDIPIAVQVQETGGIRKALALSTNQDEGQSNFLHQQGFLGRNVAQLRQFLAKGSYWINAKAVNEDVLLNFDQRESFCDTFTMVVTVHPIKQADKLMNTNSDEEFCEDMDPLVNTLTTDGMVQGHLVKELTKYGAEVGYFDFENSDMEGPFMVYFQLDYDMSQEGVVALVLSQYDKDYSTFTEIGLYEVSDSATTVFQIVERGTYAISIQSIVSTKAKFGQVGFNRDKIRTTPMLSSYCFRGVYTYMVASINEHDGSMSGFVAYNFMDKANRVRVMETLDDVRNLREFATCNHQQLPQHFPISDEGFEKQYAFLMTNAAKQVIDLIIEEPSLVRVVLNIRNKKNVVHAHLLSPGDVDQDGHPLAESDSSGSLIAHVEPDQHPYMLKLIHTDFDMDDPCPVYDLHIAVKPLRYIVNENLMCMGYELPPETIQIEKKTEKIDVPCSISSSMVQELAVKGMFMYDMMIELPHSDYFLDVELKNDFLTGNFKMSAYAVDPNTNKMSLVAKSHWFDENSHEDLSLDADAMMSTKMGDKTMIQKLRFLEDVSPDILENASKLAIKIRLNVMGLLDTLHDYQLYNPSQEDVCFNFDLSFFADEVGQDHMSDDENNKLIRVDWQGKEQAAGSYDTSGRISAFCEFEKSLAQHIPHIKTSFQETIYLQPLLPNGQPDTFSHSHVVPAHVKTKFKSDDTLILGFSPFTLDKGVCYQLTFAPSHTYGDITLANTIVPELVDSLDMKICTSSCECDVLGTARCLEKDGNHRCQCHPHFKGSDCSECQDGYYRNVDGFCELGSMCVDLGGEEDCNGHGTCYQEGPTAICECDYGFTDNGLDQCGRCSDPLMKFPYDCSKQRNWVIEQEDHECETLMHIMPRELYVTKDRQNKKLGGLNNESQVIYQQRNGMCEWSGRYALIQPTFNKMKQQIFYNKDNTQDVDRKFRKQSVHHFFVQQTSMFRVYLNTLDSRVKVRWTIKSYDQEVVAGDENFKESVVGFGMITPVGMKPNESLEHPYTLYLEYEHEQEHKEMEMPDCPKIELHFIVEPAKIHTESLECTDDELQMSKEIELDKKLTFGDENYIEEKTLVLPSTWVTDPDRYRKESVFDNVEEHKLAKIEIEVNVKKPGILSVIAASDFSNTNVFINLVAKKKNRLVAMEKNFMLDDVETNEEHLGEQSDFGVARNHDAWDFLSVLEVAHLEAGPYKIQIAVPKGSWFAQKTINTCLTLDLMLEFIPKDNDFGSEEQAFLNDSSGPVDIISIYPPSKNDVQMGETLQMMVHFNRQIDFREVANKLTDLSQICRLQNSYSKTDFINPKKYFYDKDQAKLLFDFAKDGDRVNEIYKDNGHRDNAACWVLRCKDSRNDEEDIYFRLNTEPAKYCFNDLGDDHSVSQHDAEKCNPAAKAKKMRNGACQCPPPYTGKLCHQCEAGFMEQKEKSRLGEITVCVPEDDSDMMECNGFGHYNRNTGFCDCEHGYAGHYCEMCDDIDFEYPDCTGLMDEDLMDFDAYDAYNEQRREQVYHEDYHIGTHLMNPFQQQCQYTNFPNFLNQIQNHKEFISGEFHLADVYTVNHDEDNVIEFTPRSKGFFKIMLKQPEREEAVASDESMHLEIGIVKQDGSSSMKTSINHEVNFKKERGGDNHIIIDFAVLELEIDKEIVDEPLLIYFRGLNQTHDEDLFEPQLCTEVFIEIEFRALQNIHACETSYPEITEKKSPIVLEKDMTWPATEEIHMYQVADNSEEVPFFFAQEFYIKNDESLAEFDIEIQLAQKFIDQHLIVPVVEILELDIDLEDWDKAAHKIGPSPKCELECLVAGHKLYNAFTILTSLPHGSMIRVWLYQNPALNPIKLLGKQEVETCVNFALTVRTVSEMSAEHEEALKENLYCEHTRYMPRSLNRLRYLGDPNDKNREQQDFNYIENFRVDNLKHEGRQTNFTLSERTVVRIDGVEHEQLMFFLKIYKGKSLVAGQDDSLLDGTEAVLIPSIFTVLEPGEYNLKVEFVAREMEILKQPCQSIQLQIAMNRADQDYLYPRDATQSSQTVPISLDAITNRKDQYFEARILPVSDDNGKFQVLYDEVVFFEERDDLNIIMKANSDFLRADIQFMLIGLSTDHHYMPQHKFEDSKKMVIMDLPPDYYRIVVFMQNIEMARNTIFQPVLYNVQIQLYSFEEKAKTYVQPVRAFEDDDVSLGEMIGLVLAYSTPEKLECLASGRKLPAELTENILLHETDFSFTFTIPGEDLAYTKQHVIKYRPEQGEDVLRIQIDEGIKIKLYPYDGKTFDESKPPIASSHDKLGNNVQELVSERLSSSTTYAIVIQYASDADDLEEKSMIECLQATMSVKIANSKTEYTCLRNSLTDWKDKIEKQPTSYELSYKVLADKGKHVNMVGSNGRMKNGDNKLTATTIDLVIKEDNSDLEVTIEESDHLYGSLIQIYSIDEEDDGSNSSTDSDRGLGKTMQRIFGNRQAIEPSSITSPKHMTKLRYMDLSPGKYKVRLIQPMKPQTCENVVDVLFQVSQSLDSSLVQRFASGKSTQVRYQSKLEVSQHGVFKLPTVLPLQLNSYRFLGGAGKEGRYLLFSDEYSLADDETKNMLNLGKIAKDENMYVRVFVEDSSVNLNLTCWDDSNKETRSQQTMNQYLESTDLPQENTCSIGLYHQTKKDFATNIFLQDKVRVTILVARTEFVKQKYRDFHKEGLAACPTNQWPLALAKMTEINTNSDEQSYYNYPLIRYPLKGAFGNPITMNNYYFRFNETQRFYFEVGSNFVVNHAVLKLSPTQKAFGAYEIIGKQLGNINVIDADVPPGDYKLEIMAYKNADIDCGMFSLRGLLNMHSAMSEHLPGSSVLRAGSSMCEILNSEAAPTQIFADESKTRKGNEAVIDPNGDFFRHYPNLLVVRQHNEVLEPWTHEMLVDLPKGTSFLQLIFSLEQADRMTAKVYNKGSTTRVTQILSQKSTTNDDRSERKLIFKLEGGQSYQIQLEYSGDMYNAYGEEEPCSYFDLIIAINSVSNMAKQLDCNNNEAIQDAQSILTALPKEIESKDLNYKINGFYKMRYPEDFKQLRQGKNGRNSVVMVLPTFLDIQDPFMVQASIAFDVHMADFGLELVKVRLDDLESTSETGLPNFEYIEHSSPLRKLEKNDDQTFTRQLPKTRINPNGDEMEEEGEKYRYMIAITEKQSWLIFNEVAKQEASSDLCLPMIFKLHVNSGSKQPVSALDEYIADENVSTETQEAFRQPTILDVNYMMSKHQHDDGNIVPFNVHRITANVLMSQSPYDDMFFEQKAFMLGFQIDGQHSMRFKPADIEIQVKEIRQGKQVYVVQLHYNIDLSRARKQIIGASRLELILDIDTSELVDEDQKVPYKLTNKLQDKIDNGSTLILVEFPEDMQAKFEAESKKAGNQIRETLGQTMRQVWKMKKEGKDKKLPKNLVTKLQKLQNEDFETMDEDQIVDALQTIESLTAIAQSNLDTTEFQDDDDEYVAVKCQCVHGDCDKGDSQCSKCYTGWKGRMCDIPTSNSQSRMNSNQIDDEEEEEAIFRPKKIRDTDQTYEAPQGRRRGDKKDSSNTYKTRQSYSKGSGSLDMDSGYDLDGNVQPVGGSNHKFSAAEAEDSGGSSNYYSGGSSYTSKSDAYSAQSSSSQSLSQTGSQQASQGFLAWIFWSFIWLVQWIVYLAILLVCLLLAKAGCESLQQKLQAAKLKKKKGKRKRQNEEDGMGFIEQAVGSGDEDEEDDDGSDSPIEMTLVNRKDGGKPRSKGKGKGKKRNRKGSDSGSSEPSEKELKLFEDGDEEDRQPQNQSRAAAAKKAGYTDYNPFDAEAARGPLAKQDSAQGLLESADVVGQAVLNEIDDALSEHSEDDEFGTFV